MSSLAPGLLVAAPPLGDPNFDQSVVLLAAHGEEGAFGWIINGREIMTLPDLLDHLEIPYGPSPQMDPEPGPGGGDVSGHGGSPKGQVRLGGPVGREQVWLLYRTEEKPSHFDEQFDVGCGITVSPSQKMLLALAKGAAPPSLVGVMGYAGWAPSQLEGEIQAGAWLPTDAEASLVFDVSRDRVWQRAYERVGATPIAFTSRNVGQA